MPTLHAIALVCTSVGGFSPGTPSTDPARITAASPFEATVAFVSSSAGATGVLSHLGVESGGALTAPAISDGELGRLLFSNHDAPPGASAGIDLGLFGAGDVIHFAYRITDGVSVAPTGSTFRTDTDVDPAHLSVLNTTPVDGATTLYRVGVEDIRDAGRSDWDYNDIVFDVTVRLVPTPGTGALALASLALTTRRRRA